MGVPTIGCQCDVCLSTDPRDKRTRPSVMVQFEGEGQPRTVLIDTPSAIPLVDAHELAGPVDLFGLTFVPIPVMHGNLEVWGYRFGRAAYLTDFSMIPETSLALLEGLDVLFLDALRDTPHPTH